MLGLPTLGLFHTVLSLVALYSGAVALIRSKQILLRDHHGRVYLVTTFLTAATALGIYQHGGFGPPHALALLTLGALAVGMVAATTTMFGAAARHIQTVSFSITLLFHLIPGVTESLTRLPPSAPVLASAEAPEFKTIYGLLFLAFLVGVTLQLRMLRAKNR